MIEGRDYANALPLLQQVVAKDPKNADAYNLMGFATRKSGNANGRCNTTSRRSPSIPGISGRTSTSAKPI